MRQVVLFAFAPTRRTTHLVLLPFAEDDAVAMARLTTPPGRSATAREAMNGVYIVGYECEGSKKRDMSCIVPKGFG